MFNLNPFQPFIPKGAFAVNPFVLSQYLGKWFEIARLDYFFEKGLNNVTATYSMKSVGFVKVDNRGYDFKKGKWKESVGKAKLAGDADEGRLKVSFFGPFYAPYNIISIDDNYNYALVVGKNLHYLWILSRVKTIPEDIKLKYLALAKDIGYNTNDLIWVEHEIS